MRGTLGQFVCAAAIVLGVSLSGCRQDEGERCEVDSDCSAGLVCNSPLQPNGGVCGVTRTGNTVPDAAVTARDGSTAPGPDAPAASADTGADQASSSDLAPDGSADSRPDLASDSSSGN
jgi:hypothetical protein